MPFIKRRRSYSAPGMRKRRRTVRRAPYRRAPYRRRRFAGNRRRMSARSSRIIKSLNLHSTGLPQTLITEMTFRDFGNLSASTPISYRLNGLWQPRTGVTHQPRGFDQFLNNQWYTNYTVYKADVEVKFRNRGDDDAMAAVNADVTPTFPEAITPASLFLMGELPYLNTKILSGRVDGSDNQRWTFKATYRPHKLLGLTKAQLYADPQYSGTVTTNPVSPYLNIVASDNPQDNVGLSVDFEVYIKYHVKLFRNKHDVPPSVV